MRYLSMYVSKGKIFQGENKIGKQMLKIGMCLYAWKKGKEPMVVEAERAREDIRKAKGITALKVFDFYSALNSKTLQDFQLRR